MILIDRMIIYKRGRGGNPVPSGQAVGAVGGDDGADLGWAEAGGGEGGPDPVLHGSGEVAGDQGDGAAAEAGPGHAGPDRPGGQGRLDGGVELGRGHLVVVAQRGVGGGQQGPRRSSRPARSSATASSTRAFSVTTWRARRSPGSPRAAAAASTRSGVASRRAGTPRTAAAASQAARRSA